MPIFSLAAHPAFPPTSVCSVEVELTANDWKNVLLDFRITGESVVIPEWRTPSRADGLWKSTCFEAFLKIPGLDPYYEFNFSPSGRWAAYAFDGYRNERRDLELAVAPHVEVDPNGPLRFSVDLDLSDTPNIPMLASITAVVEERDGTMSYWATAHPPGDKPDFHHADCFVIEFSAARQA